MRVNSRVCQYSSCLMVSTKTVPWSVLQGMNCYSTEVRVSVECDVISWVSQRERHFGFGSLLEQMGSPLGLDVPDEWNKWRVSLCVCIYNSLSVCAHAQVWLVPPLVILHLTSFFFYHKVQIRILNLDQDSWYLQLLMNAVLDLHVIFDNTDCILVLLYFKLGLCLELLNPVCNDWSPLNGTRTTQFHCGDVSLWATYSEQ